MCDTFCMYVNNFWQSVRANEGALLYDVVTFVYEQALQLPHAR